MRPDFTLYSYFRSSAAYRVRIALGLKNIVPEFKFVQLLEGDQQKPAYHDVNPQGLVPALIHKGRTITQSLAIIEYLDEVAPTPPLLPSEALARARVRQLAYAIACDIHPLNNLRVLRQLKDVLKVDEAQRTDWQHHWIGQGLHALETWLERDPDTGFFCHGDSPTLADICLVPQMANARRVAFDLAPFPILRRIEEAALALPAFDAARPEKQPDAR